MSRLKRALPPRLLRLLRRARRPQQNLLFHLLRTRYSNPNPRTWPGAMVFLIGSSRSGTTLLSNILAAAGARVDNYGEPRETFRSVLGLSIFDRRYLGLTSVDAIREELYQSRIARLREGRVYAEKWPGNLFLVRELAAVFPGARFVHIIRDGRNVADSAGRRYGGEWLSGALNAFTPLAMNREGFDSKLPAMGRGALRWKIHVETALSNLAELDVGRSHTLRYEELLSEPEATIEALFSFLDLDYDREKLPAIRAAESDRWRDWPPEEKRAFRAVAGKLLVELGYAADHEW